MRGRRIRPYAPRDGDRVIPNQDLSVTPLSKPVIANADLDGDLEGSVEVVVPSRY